MDSLQNEPQKELDDQDLLSILSEMESYSNSFQNNRIIELKSIIRGLGLNCALKLCSLAIQNNVHQNVKYLIFSNLSNFLHPRAPPEFLFNVLNLFVPLVLKEQSRVSKVAICKCIANAFFHLASDENVQTLSDLLKTFGNDSIIFLSELINVLKCALDVPMLSLKNFVIIVNVLPMLFPIIIDCFFNEPDSTTLEILMFYLNQIRQPPLEELLKNIDIQIQFNIYEFIQQTRNVLDSKMLLIIPAFENPKLNELKFHVYLSNLLNFFSSAVVYGINPMIIMEIMNSIFKIQINSDNIECFCEMIKTVISHQKDILSSPLMNFLFITALDNAKQFLLENLKIILNTISYIYGKLYEPFPSPDCPVPIEIFLDFTQQILPFLIRQYPTNQQATAETYGITTISMNGETKNEANENCIVESDDDDDDDQYELDLTYREEIIQYLSFISRDNPLPSLGLIEQIFIAFVESGQADAYVCEWVLDLMKNYLQINISLEKGNNETEIISQVTQKIIASPIIIQFASLYPSILCFLCDIYESIDDKQMGLSVFRLAIVQHSTNDIVMEKALDLAMKYKFSLLDEIPPDAPLSLKILKLLSSLSPSPAIIERVDNLMQSGDTNKMQEATALLVGIQKSKMIDFPLNIMNYTIELSNQQMFSEALKISHFDPEACMKIINIASLHEYDEDTNNRIILNALRASSDICFGPLTEKVLIYSKPNRALPQKIHELITKLFLAHKEQIKNGSQRAIVTDQSLIILINFALFLMNGCICSMTLISNIIESFIFFFNRIYPLVDDNFWFTIIYYYFHNNMEYSYRDYYDLLFDFSLIDFNRYRAIILAVLSQATDNSEELFAYLHHGITEDTPEMRNNYHVYFIRVYKAFDYYRHFT